MALTQISTGGIKDTTIDTADIANDAVDGTKLANNIDIAGSLDVTNGITSDSTVSIINTSANPTLALQSADNGMCEIKFGDATDTVRGNIIYRNGTAGDALCFNGYNNAERMRIDSSGRLLKGLTTARGNYGNNTSGVEYEAQIEGTSATSSTLAIVRNSNDANDGGIVLGKTRSGSTGGNTVVQASDDLGNLTFAGSDGTSMLFGAEIVAQVQSGVGNDDMPTDLIFKVNGGSTSTTERVRIDSSGKVGIGVTAPDAMLSIVGGESATPRFAIESAGGDHFTMSQFEDSNGVYTLIGQNVKIDASGNEEILDSGHRTASINFDGRNNGALVFNTGDTNAHTEAMRIDKSQRILIGSGAATTTESNRFIQVVGDTNGGGIITLARDDSSLSNETIGGFEFFGNDTSGGAFAKTASISVEAAANWDGSDYPSQMVFKTTVDGTNTPARKLELGHNYVQTNCSFNANSSDNSEALATFVEGAGCKLYHDGSQRLETTGNGATIHSGTTSSPGCLKIDCGVGAQDQVYISFEYGGDNDGGGVRRDGASQTPEFYAGSDRRIKKDIVDLAGTLSKLNQIQLKSFKYKNDPDATGIGPIAQDLISIFPNKVKKSDGDDGTGDTVPDGVEPWTVGTGFTWEIIKAIQELSAKVTALEAK